MSWRTLRVTLLLLVLAGAAVSTVWGRWQARAWRAPLVVALIPVDADRSPATAAYVAGLRVAAFASVERFLADEGARYGLGLAQPVQLVLAAPLEVLPPAPPAARGALDAILWSLQMRAWSWRHGDVAGADPLVRLYLLYHDPARSPRLAHSLGLQKGRIGVVQLFASSAQEAPNALVATHELLHTLGATDKYDPATGQPLYPDGYAEPAREPLLPQALAEIMGGRIALDTRRAVIPEGLEQARVGERTAREIGWLR